MSRVKVDWRTSSRESFNDFKSKNKSINLNFEEWKKIIYAFNEAFRDYILETGEKGRLPSAAPLQSRIIRTPASSDHPISCFFFASFTLPARKCPGHRSW